MLFGRREKHLSFSVSSMYLKLTYQDINIRPEYILCFHQACAYRVSLEALLFLSVLKHQASNVYTLSKYNTTTKKGNTVAFNFGKANIYSKTSRSQKKQTHPKSQVLLTLDI